jgi:hypothetical protein
MDNIRIYNRTLSAANVKGLYTGRPASPAAFHIVGP